MIRIHMFLKRNYSIGFVIRNQSFLHLSSWIYSNYWILITKYTMHYLCVYQINFCIVIYTIKTPTLRTFAIWFQNLLFSMQFFQVLLHIFSLPFFGFLLVFVWTIGFASNPSSKTTSFIHISIVSLFPFIIFLFAKDCSIGSFHKTMSKDNAKNNYSSTNYAKNSNKISNQKKEKKKSGKKTFTSKWV